MIFGVMITNNSDRHPADYWAEVTAGQIAELLVDTGQDTGPAATNVRRDKRRFEDDLTAALEAHHKHVQDHEIGKLGEHNDDRLKHSMDPAEHNSDTLDAAVKDVLEASKINPAFEKHFAKPEVQGIVWDILRNHFGTSIYTERAVYASKNAHSPVAKDWLKAVADHGAGDAHAFLQHSERA